MKVQITRVVDPLGGSYYVEALTHSLAQAARGVIARVEAAGGMTQAVEAGWPKLEIEAAAARRQARIDRGEDVIVGVNKFRLENEPPIDSSRHRQRPGARGPDRQARKAESLARSRQGRQPRWTP